jgi:hypothetical protein
MLANSDKIPRPASSAAVTGAAVVMAEPLADHRFYHDVEVLHRLGARAVYEALAQAGRERGCRTYLETLVHAYATRLSPELLAAAGGDRPLRLPIHSINFDKQGSSP